MAALDALTRQGGDVRSDMQYFRDFYDGLQRKFPDQFRPVRLREEDDSDGWRE
ncbi:MAG: hypothetical protein IPG64_22030 [Haliea sp.]|nr:hypothetical protein [Haliea sp.]